MQQGNKTKEKMFVIQTTWEDLNKFKEILDLLGCASNISHTQSPNRNVSHLVLQLSLPNPSQPGVKLRMNM